MYSHNDRLTGKFVSGGSTRSKLHVLFWAQNIKMPLGMGHSILHTKPNLYECRSTQRQHIFKQNQNILICLRFIAFLVILATPGLGGWDGWMDMPPPHAHIYMHACTCTQVCVDVKKYMLRNCKWLTSWVSCLACLTCVMVWGTHPNLYPTIYLPTPNPPTLPPIPTSRVYMKSLKMQ